MDTYSRIKIFLDMAFDDYVDARILIRQNRLLNGGHLSALASEKVLKALALICGFEPRRDHLDKADRLLNPILEKIPNYKNCINVDFIHYLGRIYTMRYYPDRFDDQISISRNKLLWELDRFFDQIHSTLKFEPKDQITAYTKEKESGSVSIYEENQWLSGKGSITELETIPDFLEAILRTDIGVTVAVRKEFPKTFITSKLGEELEISRSAK
jgi:hypothetical protein